MLDKLTPQQRSYCMSRIKGTDTGPEIKVRSALHKAGFRFRKNVKKLPGKPDIVFGKVKLAIFIDGDFWHGYNLESWEEKLSDFWKIKITKNMQRDIEVTQKLEEMGWTAIRIWEHDVEDNFDYCINLITSVIHPIK